MKIINITTNETIKAILGGEKLTLDEAINFVGEIINDTNDDRWSDDGDNVIIDGERYWYEDLDFVADTTPKSKTFIVNNGFEDVEYTVERCTAIAASIGETERTDALYVSYIANSGEKVEHIVFNRDMPEDDAEFADMCEDSNAWDGWYGTLETVEFD